MRQALMLLCCCLPLKHLAVTSPFGYRVNPVTRQYSFHNGVDLAARHDTVYAVFDGTASVGYDEKLGVFVSVTDSGLTCTYGHLSAILISAGPVISGQAIAITGATGRVTGEHLHFGIKYKGQAIDPIQFLYQLIKK
ncbi:MAG: M23 family metallopeptidase [Bacteroidota bacterium]|nr:M23 family metallopeptidase [Bacteroidota bacterium]